jgi:hypothetical protein
VVLPLVPGFERAPARRRPLPDAGALRLVPVPDSAPPYDDGRARDRSSGRAAAGTGPAAFRPAGGPAERPGAEAHRAAEPPRPAGTPGPGVRRPPRPAPAAPPGSLAGPAWPSQFAQVLAETLAGSRPQKQITPWTTGQARRVIREIGPMLTAGAAPRVRRVVTTRPAAGVVEMTVIVGCGSRVRALAVRLEAARPGRPAGGASTAGWVCTTIEAA